MPLKFTAVGRSNMVKLLKVLTCFRNIKHTWVRKYLHLCGLSKKQNKQTKANSTWEIRLPRNRTGNPSEMTAWSGLKTD